MYRVFLRVRTWMQGFLSAHQWVGTDDVDQAPGASFYFIHRKSQIMELVLKRNTEKLSKKPPRAHIVSSEVFAPSESF